MAARLASGTVATALIRKAEGAGGFAAVLAKGDPTAGALLVILAERGERRQALEKQLQTDGSYCWGEAGSAAEDGRESFESLIARRRRYDPDLWILELDVPSAERFADEMNAFD